MRETGCCDRVQQGEGRGARAVRFRSVDAASACLLALCERERRGGARPDLLEQESRGPELGGEKR